ncbi:MAG TPA: amidohydrolase family protein [Burkholderiales bacterium]|nr:amidohydrolase family protein [Burkholderiales bacterium]
MLPDNVWPVSVNDHVVEPATLWTERLSRAQAARGPHLVDTPDGGQAWRFGDEVLPLSRMVGSDINRADPARPVKRFADIADHSWKPAARLAAMDREQVGVHTLFPHAVMGFSGERFAKLGDAALWAECVRTWNDFVLREFCPAAPERLVGVAILPLADPGAMVKEIERVAPLGARGISLPHDPAALGLPSFHLPSWQRVLDAADAAGMPMFIHIASSGIPWPDPQSDSRRSVETLVAAMNMDVMQTACDLAFSPLLTERPNRRVALLEANASWMPYLEERLDFATRGRKELAPKGRPASQVMHEQMLASFLNDPLGIEDRHRIGVERLLWQSDFPHVDSLWPHSRPELAKALADVPDHEASQIAAGNARRLLRLPQQA